MKQTFVASASELHSSPLFLQIKAPMFLADEPNLNKVSVTEAFIDDIIENQEKYLCLPLVADVQKLVAGKYQQLTHNFNPITQTFGNPTIGSFSQFEKQELEDGRVALVGYMRVFKRYAKVCKALSDLFVDSALKFSFEMNAGSYTKQDDGTIVIDAADDNYLEGLCVVSFPACPEAVAEQLVAEMLTQKDGDLMDNEKIEAEVEVAETEVKDVEETKIEAEAEVEETKVEAEQEAAELRVTETHIETDVVEAHDWENDEHAYERTTHEVTVTTTAQEDEKADEDKNLFAQLLARMDEMTKQIAELTEIVNQTKEEKSEEQVIAEINDSEIGAGENKIVAEMNTGDEEQSELRRSLLEPEQKITAYTLL